ncbi:MAG: hypothetical protein ACAI43_27485 [Phycisphaerae bacterium]|nr:hypothetical protein [Tepidisphaeraceae bacterium]
MPLNHPPEMTVLNLQSLTSKLSTAAAVAYAPALTPVGAQKSLASSVAKESAQVLRGTGAANSLAERGIIIVSGKGGSPDKSGAADTAAKAGIIIVSGRGAGRSLAERGIIIVSGNEATPADAARARLGGRLKQLEGNDRMGNFEIQRLMSAFNQAETLSSNVQKKMDDTVSGQQQKIG